MNDVRLLTEMLCDCNRDNRSAAALQLGKLGQADTVDRLVQALLVETDLNVLEDITWALSQLRQSAVPALIAQLQSASEEIRHRATHTLGKLGSEHATDVLIEVLRDDSDVVRYKAAVALGQIKDVRAISALIQALGDEVLEVSQGASDALAEFDALAVEHLLEALHSSSEKIRETAAYLLGEIASPATVDSLIAALADPSHDVQIAASISLGLIGDQRATAPLENLQNNPDKQVRAAARRGLDLLR